MSIYGGDWGAGTTVQDATASLKTQYKNTLMDMLASSRTERQRDLERTAAAMQARGLDRSGLYNRAMADRSRQFYEQDQGLALGIADRLSAFDKQELDYRNQEHMFELGANRDRMSASDAQGNGMMGALGGLAVSALTGNPYAALMGGGGQSQTQTPTNSLAGGMGNASRRMQGYNAGQNFDINSFAPGWAGMYHPRGRRQDYLNSGIYG